MPGGVLGRVKEETERIGRKLRSPDFACDKEIRFTRRAQLEHRGCDPGGKLAREVLGSQRAHLHRFLGGECRELHLAQRFAPRVGEQPVEAAKRVLHMEREWRGVARLAADLFGRESRKGFLNVLIGVDQRVRNWLQQWDDSVDRSAQPGRDEWSHTIYKERDAVSARDFSVKSSHIGGMLLGEVVKLVLLIAVVSSALFAWVRMTPPGVLADDELEEGEKLLWSGAPKQGFDPDLRMIAFSAFAVMWFAVLYIALRSARRWRLPMVGVSAKRLWPIAALLIAARLGAQGIDSSRARTWAEIFMRARQAQNAQDNRLAKVLYDSVIALDPRNSMAYLQRGIVHHNLGDREKSISDFRKSELLGNPQAASVLAEISTPVASPDAPSMQQLERDARNVPGWLDSLGRIPSGLAGEIFMLLVLIAIVSAGLAFWVKVTPPGMTSEDEIQPGEKLLWSGAPARSLFVDLTYIPSTVFAVIWFTILYIQGFRFANLLRDPDLFTAFQFVFAFVGVWTLVGRYFNELRRRKQSTYLLTDQRALVTHGSFITEHKLEDLRRLKAWKHMDGTYTLGSPEARAIFRHIADGDRVKTMIDATLARAGR
jgi:hypothetical protein